MNASAQVGEKGAARPRVLLVTSFFPGNERAVYGAFQRLGTHVEGLRRFGTVDVIFLWPGGHAPSATRAAEHAQRARQTWGIDGTIGFIATRGNRRKPVDWLLDLFWACRGALGFAWNRPSMRSSGRVQARAMRRVLRAQSPDLIFAHRLEAGALMLRTRRIACPIVLDMDDLEHVRMKRRALVASGRLEKAWALGASLLARFAEGRVISACSSVLVCSELDRTKLGSRGSGRISVVPNSVPVVEEMGSAATPTAVFVGIALYAPNREAIHWLTEDIWPRVRARIPDARLVVVGEGSDALGLVPSVEGIEFLGFQASLHDVYDRARLVLCPVRRGGGTRIKIIEAAMRGRAIVSTTVGAEGLAFEPKTEILIADTAADFADRCVEVLTDPALAASLGRAARLRARANYERERVAEQVAALCRKVWSASLSKG